MDVDVRFCFLKRYFFFKFVYLCEKGKEEDRFCMMGNDDIYGMLIK